MLTFFKFFEVPQFRNITLKCFTEIGAIEITQVYYEAIYQLFVSVMATTNIMVPPNTDIADIYENSNDNDQEFVQNLALFLTSFLSSHLKVDRQ